VSHTNWALYAKKRRLGTMGEHQHAGAWLRPVGGVGVEWTVMKGWELKVFSGRLSLQVALAPSHKDPRLDEWLAVLFQDGVRSRLKEAFAEDSPTPVEGEPE